MAQSSTIEWTDASWNPVTGCDEISPGCDHCYAKVFAERWRGIAGHPYQQGFDLKLWPERLILPLRWKKPRRIFVNSMSDLFHKDVPDSYIADVFRAMLDAPHHIYQVLTKRPKRMVRWFESYAGLFSGSILPSFVWIGTTIERDDYTWRADYLRRVPALVRFISAEPLLSALPSLKLDGLHWVIVGGESGHGARPAHPDWFRDLRDRCQATGVAFFFKQWGAYAPVDWQESISKPALAVGTDGSSVYAQVGHALGFRTTDEVCMARVGKHAAGRLLDGREWNDMPAGVPARG